MTRHPNNATNGLSRRTFLSQLTVALSVPTSLVGATACSLSSRSASNETTSNEAAASSLAAEFDHGVASGDPLEDRVILWTRVTPTQDTDRAIPVQWVVSTDVQLGDVVLQGEAVAEHRDDFTVKVDAIGLNQATTYYYQFKTGNVVSPVGRTRTLPVGSVEHMRLAVASCANYPGGYFHAYRHIAERSDLDLVLHLGDYLYEYGNHYFGDGTPLDRVPSPDSELFTLADYRQRHGQYKQDADLQQAHRQHPFVTVWDDHEIANDAHTDGAQNHQASEGSYEYRRAAAVQAYLEWMPIRTEVSGDVPVIYRSLHCGDLLQITMLDARLHGRDPQLKDPCDVASAMRQDRSILGVDQEAWLLDQLDEFSRGDARWCVLGQQVMLGQLSNPDTGCIADPDQWDGYSASRDRLLRHLAQAELDNVVVVTGDAHSSWATDLALDPFDAEAYDGVSGEGSLAVEFVVPGISSAGPGGEHSGLGVTHPHIKYAELSRQGYVILDITPERIQADWLYTENVRSASSSEEFGTAFLVRDGTNRAAVAPGPSPTR